MLAQFLECCNKLSSLFSFCCFIEQAKNWQVNFFHVYLTYNTKEVHFLCSLSFLAYLFFISILFILCFLHFFSLLSICFSPSFLLIRFSSSLFLYFLLSSSLSSFTLFSYFSCFLFRLSSSFLTSIGHTAKCQNVSKTSICNYLRFG